MGMLPLIPSLLPVAISSSTLETSCHDFLVFVLASVFVWTSGIFMRPRVLHLRPISDASASFA